jgi:succinate dehydrogenase / fumarate reductase cytochrome b subunit
MAMSILTRATGAAAFAGMFLLTGWALALASGSGPYEAYMRLLGSLPGRVVLFGLTLAVFLHLAGGVRHLAWDLGMGYDKAAADASARAAMAFALMATFMMWTTAWAARLF